MSDAATTLTGGQHGTKVLGTLATATAVISGIDPTLLPPSWLPYFGGVLGLLTLVRGFVNTKNQQK
jgi:hypothetical protein